MVLNQEALSARNEEAPPPAIAPMNFFAMIKKLTLVGYYPSEAGFKDELHKSTIPTKHHMQP